jgi:hypothetical protein
MRILFDHGTPDDLAQFLDGHEVTFARRVGWDRLSNGQLLRSAEDAGFELMLTVDQRIRYQQNLTGRKIALVVLTGSSKWQRVSLRVDEISTTVQVATPGSYTEVFIPFAPRPGSIRNR